MTKSERNIITINASYEDGVLLDAGLEFALMTLEDIQQILLENFNNSNELFADIDTKTLPKDDLAPSGFILTCRSIKGHYANTRYEMPMALITCDAKVPDKTIVKLGSGNPNSKWKEMHDIDSTTAAEIIIKHFITFHETQTKGGAAYD